MYFFISEIGWMFRPHHHPHFTSVEKSDPVFAFSRDHIPEHHADPRVALPHFCGFTRSCPSSSLSKPNSRVVFTCTIFSIVSSQTTTALRHHCCSSPPKRQLPGGWPQYSVASFHITRPMPPSSPHHAPSSNVHVRRASGSLHLP